MKIAAIIAEYNPFHKGHKYQINRAREILGEDTAIIAIMSGNFTQRGELAIADKTIRAMAAVECGVNLVLELPFPYSMSSAEFFARSGIHIATKLGIVDYLVFGSELGDTDTLYRIAKNMNSSEFKEKLGALSESAAAQNLGYPKICEVAYRELFGSADSEGLFTPNNILALEYIKALINQKSSIKPLTVKRIGAGYNDKIDAKNVFQSASGIRAKLSKCEISALDYIPEDAKNIFCEAISNGKMPSMAEKLDIAVISQFRLNSPNADVDVHDAGGGLYNRLLAMSDKTTSISSLVSMTETKKYTNARIRRAIWNSYFGVTSSDVRTLPAFSQVLAMDAVGRSLLQRIKKVSDFYIVTKPSSYKELPECVVHQKELSNRADSIFGLALKNPNSGAFPITFTPYVKK